MASVEVRHKKAAAIWTDGKKFYPLPESGRPIMTPYAVRPTGLVFAGDLPAIGKIIKILSPEIVSKTEFLTWVENRRWNISLTNGGEIWLPEADIAGAVAQINALDVMDRKFYVLDLRDPNRATVKQ
jgi:cell division septal protein FtsQ